MITDINRHASYPFPYLLPTSPRKPIGPHRGTWKRWDRSPKITGLIATAIQSTAYQIHNLHPHFSFESSVRYIDVIILLLVHSSKAIVAHSVAIMATISSFFGVSRVNSSVTTATPRGTENNLFLSHSHPPYPTPRIRVLGILGLTVAGYGVPSTRTAK